MKKKKFLRRDSVRFSKLGKNRRKIQKWRKPKGRDNKMRLKRKSYPSVTSIGHASPRKSRVKLTLIQNLSELSLLGRDSVIILAKIGAKKKLEIIKAAQEKGIKIKNLNGVKNEIR